MKNSVQKMTEFLQSKPRCTSSTKYSDEYRYECDGKIKLHHFRWCGQYVIRCDKCLNAPEKYSGFPVNHGIAMILKSFLGCIELSKEESEKIREKNKQMIKEQHRAFLDAIREPEPVASVRSSIPTSYNGINFRSRLEAKWAKMFDLLGWNWEYEPFDLDGYIPDFVLQVPIYAGKGRIESYIVEIKPAMTRRELWAMATESQNKALEALPMSGRSALRLGATLSLDGVPGCVGIGDISIDVQGMLGEPVGIIADKGTSYLVPYPDWGLDGEIENSFSDVQRLWREATNTVQYSRVSSANT